MVGVDLSPGMLAAARHPTGRVLGDIERLPFRSAAFDAVLALHMVYHAPHPDRAVAELRRSTRAGGVAVVSTNGPRHFEELAVLSDTRMRGSQAFGLDRAAEMLGRVFSRVERHDFIDELIVSDPEPVISYLRSTISLGADPATLAEAERQVRQEISSHGSFRITAAPGALICR
jgi:SAM-dependent methyltransferase